MTRLKTSLFALLVLFSAAIGALAAMPQAHQALGMPIYYENTLDDYQVRVPAGFEIDSTVPELVSMRQDGSWLRINSGCFDSGVEGLMKTSLALELNGRLTTKEEYYSDSVLRLRRFILTNRGKCYALELYSDTTAGWEVLEEAVKGFRFMGSVEDKGGSYAFLGCDVCLPLFVSGLGWPALRD